MTALAVGIACFPTLGGSGIVATEVARGLAARGHRVRVFSWEMPGRLDRADERVVFHRVDRAPPAPFAHLLDGDAYPLALAAAMAEAARDGGLDVLHAHYAIPQAAAALLARQMIAHSGARAPRVVTTLHGTDVTSPDAALLPVVRHLALESDALTVPSEWLRAAAVSRLGLPPTTPVEVIPNFVDPEAFRPLDRPDVAPLARLFPDEPWSDPARRPRVLFHGSSFRPLKRVGDAVRALAAVRKTRPAVLVLVGDGPERPRVEELARELGVLPHVAFLGALPHFADLLARADLFLLPSETESFGLAALEALAAGVPVVASAVGGLSEVVRDGETGRLVPPGDPAALAAAILALTDDEPRRRAMAAAAREDALRRFRPEPLVARYEAVYRRALAR